MIPIPNQTSHNSFFLYKFKYSSVKTTKKAIYCFLGFFTQDLMTH